MSQAEYITDDKLLNEAASANDLYNEFQKDLEVATSGTILAYNRYHVIGAVAGLLIIGDARQRALRFREITGCKMPIKGHTLDTKDLKYLIVEKTGEARI